MRYISLYLILLMICSIFIIGCTSSGSDTQIEQTPLPTNNPTVTATPTATSTVTPTSTNNPTVTATPTATVITNSEEIIIDEGASVYSGLYKIFKFEDYLSDDGFLNSGDMFNIEVSSDSPVNVLFFRDNELGVFENTPITWDSYNKEWEYPLRLKPLAKFDEITRKNFDVKINDIGKYSLCIDARVSENDLTIMNDAFNLDIKVVKLNP